MSRRGIVIAGLLLVTFEIRHECGWPIRRIGEVSGVSVGTVHAELAARSISPGCTSKVSARVSP